MAKPCPRRRFLLRAQEPLVTVAEPNPSGARSLDMRKTPRWPLAALVAATLAAVPVAALAAPSGWQVVAAPSPGKGVFNAFLASVAQVSPADVWAVGTDRGKPLIENWNGSVWSVSPVPKLPRAAGELNGVSADGANDLRAGGDTTNSQGVDRRALAFPW